MRTDATTQDHHPHAAGGLSPRFLAHANFPKGGHPMDGPDAAASNVGGCGDRITVQIRVTDETITDISALPAGCVYTIACASALCGLAQGRSLTDALELPPEAVAGELGGLPPDHLHCARLAVNTLGEAIDAYLRRRWGRARPGAANTHAKGKTMWRVLMMTETPPRFTNFVKALRDEGRAECMWADSPEAGLEMAAVQRPDLAVVDESIGGVPGLEWVKRLLAVDAFLNTAVVSALDESDFHEASEGLGVAVRLSSDPGAEDARKALSWLASA